MRIILESSSDYIYHNSPDPNIDIFVPRPIWRNKDWTESGNQENVGFVKEDVIFALDKEKSIFYSLPRDTPRILIVEKNIFILPSEEKNAIQRHSWTQYKFSKKDFEEIPSGEWICRKEIKPINKKIYNNPISHLKKMGFKIKWVEDIFEVADELRNKNIIFDAENV